MVKYIVMRHKRGILFIYGSVFFSVLLFVAFWLFDSKNSRADISITGRSGGILLKDIVSENDRGVKFRIVEYRVLEGDAWDQISTSMNIDSSLSEVLLKVSSDVHDLTSIRAGNDFKFYFDKATDMLMKLEYDIDDEELLIVRRDANEEFRAEKEKIAYKTVVVSKNGVIENSLFETALNEGIPTGIILNLATIFGWDIDFASSVQKGDSFAIVYEDRFRDGEYVGPGKILTAKFVNNGENFYAFRHKDSQGVAHYYDKDGRELRRQFLRSPLDYTRITSGFSYNRFHPILNTFTTHRAIDYAASAGTPVSATADGVVTFVGWSGGNGQFITVRHANGYSTGYAHLSSYAKGMKNGIKVRQNQVIGFVGSTGLSTGPHLHYEMRKDGTLINPLSINLPPGEQLNNDMLIEFFRERDRLFDLLDE